MQPADLRDRNAHLPWRSLAQTLTVGKHIMAPKPRRPLDPKDAAEALFAAPRKAAAPVIKRSAIPTTKEMVSLKIDSDVLAYFQDDGPGWQERINTFLRTAMLAEDDNKA